MNIQLTLSEASSVGVIAVAAVYLLKSAIGDKDAWWRLIAILAACALLWLLLRGDPTHLLCHLPPVTSVPSSHLVSAAERGFTAPCCEPPPSSARWPPPVEM